MNRITYGPVSPEIIQERIAAARRLRALELRRLVRALFAPRRRPARPLAPRPA